ncbi:Sua5p [Sugiyamaella lignohabitans]|uniref:Threonylcarbamoyl-AMP synthase n=1 Tax=Sugiyamaella lignohabitans TaxID=796027 RepID=A0A167ET97_9ASCO|nr:Sua5p [Sugiyamaella lignohabitans]ANB14426.1 Sua5p [Sugiyamaella lignohabitans]
MYTKVLPVDPESIRFDPDDINKPPSIASPSSTLDNLNEAVKILQTSHDPVAFPTETVYGLGASALDTESARAIYTAKNRPADNPLIIHVSSIEQLERRLLPAGERVPEIYRGLINKFWPGPLTIILPVPDPTAISPVCTHGQSTFAVRLPANPVARALISLSDLPLAAPSANASTKPSPTQAQHVFTDLKGKIPLILDGGSSDIGVESTVVDGLSNPPMLLRPGGVSIEQIREFGGPSWQNVVVGRATAKSDEVVRTPGMKYKHYSPRAPLTLFIGCTEQQLIDYVIRSNPSSVGLLTTRHFNQKELAKTLRQLPGHITVHDKSLGQSGADISRNLFASFREMDAKGVDLILVEGIDEQNEGLAIMNRARKAASTVISA